MFTISQIRKHLQIEKWHVFGGSWGACLQLAYAQAHPDSVLSMTLRGIFTLRKSELEFFYQGRRHNVICREVIFRKLMRCC